MPSPGRKPTVSERVERARAAAAPRLERAASEAAPKVEKAAQAAGTFLGTLRERARETAKQFNEGLNGADEPPAAEPSTTESSDAGRGAVPPGPQRPRPRPRPR